MVEIPCRLGFFLLILSHSRISDSTESLGHPWLSVVLLKINRSRGVSEVRQLGHSDLIPDSRLLKVFLYDIASRFVSRL